MLFPDRDELVLDALLKTVTSQVISLISLTFPSARVFTSLSLHFLNICLLKYVMVRQYLAEKEVFAEQLTVPLPVRISG